MSQAAQHHLDFAPPPTAGLVRSMTLALLAHLVLLAILAVGVAWKRETPVVAVQAELWAAVPVEAAPLATEQPEPQPEPKPQPEPPLPPTPPPPKVETPAPTPPKAPDIVLAKEKERLRKEKELQDAQLAQKEAQRKAQLEQQRKDQLAKEKERQEKLAKAEREKAQKSTDQAKKDAAAKEAKEQAKRTEEMRTQQLKRMAALAGGATGSGGNGTAAKSAGPSSSYAGRVVGKIKPNITFTETINSNPRALVEIRTAPDGTIVSSRLLESSGLKSWDDAVLNAIVKSETLPKDIDGRVPSTLEIGFRPKD
ncbi:MAG: cell envelope integrity protein TolA [Rhodoferax sp.]|nr:cell envelope integrity protein TolA [Rhodoferax sp.]